MALTPGTHLGPYDITAQIGVGGMGEVYRATDTRLKRQVAIKVLPASVAGDAERLARFQREAEVLAALNHPNIAAIYGLEKGDGTTALVMELVEGEDLSVLIGRGSPDAESGRSRAGMPLSDTLHIARQIADALETAHERGIIHRDLKPANIKVRADGTVKVLDFGLAKAMDPAGASSASASALANAPTITSPAMTQMGMILGTAAYMSPEQAAGKEAGQRSDVWSFGVVLYEMLTGTRLFDGETVAHTLADVLRAPLDVGRLPASTPAPIVALVTRCLDRNLRTRLRDIGEARIAIERVLASPEPPAAQTTTAPRPRFLAGWLAAVAIPTVAVAVLAFVHFREVAPAAPEQRFSLALPQGNGTYSFAISPDATHVVVTGVTNGKSQLWLRPLDSFQWRPLAFTDDATYPFWSPDSRSIAFFADGKLKRIAATGGPAQTLCDAPDGRGGSWNRDDVILFTPAFTGVAIQRVPAAGGVPVDVTKTHRGERFPVFLPDGEHFLYVLRSGTSENGIYVSSLAGMEPRRILSDVSSAAFAPPPSDGASGTIGHVLFVRDRTLMAQPFDTTRSEPAGDAFPVADGVTTTLTTFYAPVTVSENSTLLYAGDAAGPSNQLVWYDRRGTMLGRVGAPGNQMDTSLSPDEASVTFRRLSRTGYDLWLRDLRRDTETRLTTDPSYNTLPVWSPRGDRVVFSSNRRGGIADLFEKAVSGSGDERPLVEGPTAKFPSQWSFDGRFVVYSQGDPRGKWDIWVVPMDGTSANPSDRTPRPFLQGPDTEVKGQLSPDGRWMAYVSDQSGRSEIYVRAFPSADRQVMVSGAGGDMPQWRRDGRELFYIADDGRLMAVPVQAGTATFDAGAAVALFDTPVPVLRSSSVFTINASQYSVTADGQRFLVNTVITTGATAPSLNVIANWRGGGPKAAAP